MWIKPRYEDDREKITTAVRAWLAESRFTADLYPQRHHKHGSAIEIRVVRKRKRADYCGQHPGACRANGRPHRHYCYLQGADWIGFNDGLNDVLDKLNVEADVWSYNRECYPSGQYFIRHGKKRRTLYDSVWLNSGPVLWERDTDCFEDHCGKEAPPSEYPSGTPGIASWRPEDEEEPCTALDAVRS